MTYDEGTKLVDFGIAKAAMRSSTQAGTLKSKIACMAPERATGDAVDRRADIFAIGVVLRKRAAGGRMWRGADDLEVLRALARGGIPRLSGIRPDPSADVAPRAALTRSAP